MLATLWRRITKRKQIAAVVARLDQPQFLYDKYGAIDGLDVGFKGQVRSTLAAFGRPAISNRRISIDRRDQANPLMASKTHARPWAIVPR